MMTYHHNMSHVKNFNSNGQIFFQKRVEELVKEQVGKFADAYLDSVDDDSEYAPTLCRTLHTRLVYRSLKQLEKSCSVKRFIARTELNFVEIIIIFNF